MSRINRYLPSLPICAGLLLGLGAMGCGDRRDEADTRSTSEYGTTANTDSAAVTTREGGDVAAPESPTVSNRTTTTTTTTPRRTRRSSTPVSEYDPYAPGAAETSRNDRAVRTDSAARTDVSVRAEANVRTDSAVRNEATPVEARPDRPVTEPVNPRVEAGVEARAQVTAPETPDSVRVTVNAPARTDTARIAVNAPARTDTARIAINAPARIDSARIAVNAVPPRVDTAVRVDPSRANIDSGRVAVRTDVSRAEVSGNVAPRTEVGITPGVTPTPNAAESPAAGAPKSTVLNDAHIFNILLLANTGDSARAAAAALGEEAGKVKAVATVVSPVTPVTPTDPRVKADIVAGTPEVRTTSISGRVATPRGAIRDNMPLGEDCYFPTMNRHDDPKLKPECEDATVDVEITTMNAAPAPAPAARDIQPIGTPKTGPSGEMLVSAEPIRELAMRMQRDHTELNNRVATVVQRLNVAPSESPASIEVFNRNQGNTIPLTAGNERAWLEREVQLHETSLRNVETRLLPAANDAELRQVLEDTRRQIQHHLTLMRQLLGTAGTAMPADSAVRHDMHMMPPDSMRMRGDSARPDTTRVRP